MPDLDPYAAFRTQLLEAGLLVPTGVEGLYGRSATFQDVADSLDSLVTRLLADKPATMLHFPPIVARSVFDRTDYVKSFPDLMGSVHVFRGGDREHAKLLGLLESGGDWPRVLEPAEVVLCSAACHPLYPLCTGQLPRGGRRFEVHGYCFRHEPSIDPARMQAFHMHENVYIGDPDEATTHRDRGLERGFGMLAGLGLKVEEVVANDPFFGRLGTMLASNQLEEALKIEVVSPICSAEEPTAIMSANCHRDHFGAPFEIRTADGTVAHSACVAFGIDRITLALLHTHGLDPRDWPTSTRDQLWP